MGHDSGSKNQWQSVENRHSLFLRRAEVRHRQENVVLEGSISTNFNTTPDPLHCGNRRNPILDTSRTRPALLRDLLEPTDAQMQSHPQRHPKRKHHEIDRAGVNHTTAPRRLRLRHKHAVISLAISLSHYLPLTLSIPLSLYSSLPALHSTSIMMHMHHFQKGATLLK